MDVGFGDERSTDKGKERIKANDTQFSVSIMEIIPVRSDTHVKPTGDGVAFSPSYSFLSMLVCFVLNFSFRKETRFNTVQREISLSKGATRRDNSRDK